MMQLRYALEHPRGDRVQVLRQTCDRPDDEDTGRPIDKPVSDTVPQRGSGGSRAG